MKKVKEFQVVVTIGETMMFDATNSTKEVDEWLDAFDKSVKATSVKVYQHIGNGGYELKCSRSRETERKIGFCRG